jgi:hypothetical protein
MIRPRVQQFCPTKGGTGVGQIGAMLLDMARNPKAECRLAPINHAYLDDLAKLGPYGDGKSGVMRRFIENGIRAALEAKVIAPRDVADFGDASVEGED